MADTVLRVSSYSQWVRKTSSRKADVVGIRKPCNCLKQQTGNRLWPPEPSKKAVNMPVGLMGPAPVQRTRWMMSEAPSSPLLPSEQGFTFKAQSSADAVLILCQSRSLETLHLAHQNDRLSRKNS